MTNKKKSKGTIIVAKVAAPAKLDMREVGKRIASNTMGEDDVKDLWATAMSLADNDNEYRDLMSGFADDYFGCHPATAKAFADLACLARDSFEDEPPRSARPSIALEKLVAAFDYLTHPD